MLTEGDALLAPAGQLLPRGAAHQAAPECLPIFPLLAVLHLQGDRRGQGATFGCTRGLEQ